ncbi:MAG: hypothetical protein ACFFEK_05765 [Candidatus Thorarchaeota archaeon]
MIDDDFESVFRKMMEQFMDAFGGMPEGGMTIKSWNGSIVNEPFDGKIESNDEPEVEQIDLGDSVLVLIESRNPIETPKVRVSGSEIFVQLHPEKEEINLDVGFKIDIEKSDVSYRNGVLEISAVKIESENNVSNDGYLRIN